MHADVGPERLAEYEGLRAEALGVGQANWLVLLRDLGKTADHVRTVMRLPYSSSWVFTTGRELRWAVDPVPAAGGTPEEIARIAEGLCEFDFIIITHMHGDHCSLPFLNRFAAASKARWIIPAAIEAEFTKVVDATRVTALREGEAVEIAALRISCFPGKHVEPRGVGVASGAFRVELPDGVCLWFPGDVRCFEPEEVRGVDYCFGHVWLGRGVSHEDDFPLLDPFCRFLLAAEPKHIFLGHLLEVSRPVDSMWNHRHAKLVKDRLRELAPAVEVTTPRPGSTFVLGYDSADPYAAWSEAARNEFDASLGCSIKGDVLNQLDRATAEGIPVLELNFHTLEALDREEVARRVFAWRAGGGRCLSMHLMTISDEEGPLSARERNALEWTLALECDRVTEHVPNRPVGYMREHRDRVAERYLRVLAPLLEHDIAVGIENMHMSAKAGAGDLRGYGFTIEEWLDFIQQLRTRSGHGGIGCHVDIGHAYTNYPFHPENTVETWLRAGGALINGIHLHQYECDRSESDPYPRGHQHVSGRNAGYPLFEPLYRLWGEGVFRAPMFLEVCRGPESEPFTSRRRLTAL